MYNLKLNFQTGHLIGSGNVSSIIVMENREIR